MTLWLLLLRLILTMIQKWIAASRQNDKKTSSRSIRPTNTLSDESAQERPVGYSPKGPTTATGGGHG